MATCVVHVLPVTLGVRHRCMPTRRGTYRGDGSHDTHPPLGMRGRSGGRAAVIDSRTRRRPTSPSVSERHRAVDDASAAISAAQQRFDTFAAASYINGPSGSYVSATSPKDVIATASAGEAPAITA